MAKNRLLAFVFACGLACAYAQEPGAFGGLRYAAEMQTSQSDGKTPLWLNANKHGLSSLRPSNGYLRASLERPLCTDTSRTWGLGYALDVAAAHDYTSSVVVQQAYVEGRLHRVTLTAGSREYPMQLKNNRLSSGSQTLGINARPVPQLRLALPEYWALPFAAGWLQVKGHVAYGATTDESWQHSATHRTHSYADGVLYHSKAGYLKIGGGRVSRISLELGIEMAAQFGGTLYSFVGNGETQVYRCNSGFRGYWNAFIPGGAEANEDAYKNVEGNHMGSWVARLAYETEDWCTALYADHYFEDHSAMFFLDYNGYGSGDEWDKKKKCRFFLYDFKDVMLGVELNHKKGTWLRDVVFEYIYTKYQSGPLYHDHTPSMSDHISGIDEYYNHYLYPGWQHWGQVMGNPLYRSPLYNTDGTLTIEDNRFFAFHLGVGGEPACGLSYRLLATWQEGVGTYKQPYTAPRHNISAMAELTWQLPRSAGGLLRGVSLTAAMGADWGGILGNNRGLQLTLRKCGKL